MDTYLIQKVLRYVFYLLVVITVGLYALAKYQGWPDEYWIYCGIATVGISVLRFVMRLMA